MQVTLDNNCILSLENDDYNALHIKELISMHEDKKIVLRLATISASERQIGGRYTSNFAEFQEKITCLELQQLELLKHPLHYGMSYYGQATYGDKTTIDREQEIHEILFPNIEFDYTTFCSKKGINPNNTEIDKRWQNARCDVLGLWSHIEYKGDIFVTSDNNFRKATKLPKLLALGVGAILSPEATVARLKAE